MSLPEVLPIPSFEIFKALSPETLQISLKTWELVLTEYLRLPKSEFSNAFKAGSLRQFLVSYLDYRNRKIGSLYSNLQLRRNVFLLAHRALTENVALDPSLLNCLCLGDLSRIYFKSKALDSLLRQIWRSQSQDVESSLEMTKTDLIVKLSTHRWSEFDDEMCTHRLLPLVLSLPEAGTFFAVGSDFIDSVATGYRSISALYLPKVILLVYACLIASLKLTKPNTSLCFDHLYELKSNAESHMTSQNDTADLLADLVSETPLLDKIDILAPRSDRIRARTLISALEKFRRAPKEGQSRHKKKSDSSRNVESGGVPNISFHVHQRSFVNQIQDLFPALGSMYILKLLDEYDDDVETVISHLLDDSLPQHLEAMDRTENLLEDTPRNSERPEDLPSGTAPSFIPSRRNVFDNDEFDRLTIDSSRLHRGKTKNSESADTMLLDRTQAPNKAAILSTLAAFDSDDDERDDTYDLEDVGGTVDAARSGVDDIDTHENRQEDQLDQVLFGEYRKSPEVFQRDVATRRGKARQNLKNSTGLTDEAIEGWAIMVGRDPSPLRKLEGRYSGFTGHQREVNATAWRADSATEDSETSGTEGTKRGGHSRQGGRDGRGRGRVGTVNGSADEQGTRIARDRKEAHKGARANHNRRDQRARKMARGGFSG